MHAAAAGEHPHLAEPQQKHRDDQPKAGGVRVQYAGVGVGDVHGHHDDGGVGGTGSEGAKLLEVGDEVTSAVGDGLAAFAQTFEFTETLNEGERKKEKDAETGQPRGDGHAGGGAAGEDADGVQTAQDEDVQEQLALEIEGVGEGGGGVEREPVKETDAVAWDMESTHSRKDVRQKQCHSDRGEQHEHDRGHAGEGGKIAGGKGAAAFARVAAVRLDVEEVVDDVGRRGAQAEADERDQRGGERGHAPGVCEQHRDEDQGVFGPLVQANGFEPTPQRGRAVVEGAGGGDAAAGQPVRERAVRVGDHGRLASGEDFDVGFGVADVAEAVAEVGAKGDELVVSGEIGGTVGGKDAGKQAEKGGNAVGQGAIRGSGKVDGAALLVRRAKPIEQGLVVGQMFDIEGDGLGDVALEGGLAFADPARDLEQACGVLTGKGEDRIDEGVGLDEGAVEVDAQRHAWAEGWGVPGCSKSLWCLKRCHSFSGAESASSRPPIIIAFARRASRTKRGTKRRLRASRLTSRMKFGKTSPFAVGVAVWVGMAAGRAQMHHVDAPERVTRAVGVYEWTGDLNKPTAARFVPICLFIDGRYEDAGLYLARPVPFALQSGDLYTVERAGEPQGALELEMAERVVTGNALADDNPAGVWYGFGKFTAEAAPKVAAPLHRSAHVGVIQASGDSSKATTTAAADPDDGRPHMTRRTPAGSDAGSGSGSGSSGSAGSSSTEDTDRPTLARRDPTQDAGRRRTAVGGKGSTASVTAVGPTPGDDPDRPTLTHKSADAGTKELTGMPADLHQAVAVSDPVLREPHPFARAWEDPAERASTLAALEVLAKPRVTAYLAENKLVPTAGTAAGTAAGASSQSTEGIAANTESGAGAAPKLQRGKPREYGGGESSTTAAGPTTPKVRPGAAGRSAHPAGRSAKASPAAPLSLRDEQVSGFTLSYGGLPTFVYTASVPAAVAPGSTLPGAGASLTAFVTLVAQRLPSGELQVAMSAVTDSQHLDRGPRLHLIDAVDPDASHRASLLFELRGSASRQFALYRLVTAKAENTFTSASIE